MKIAIFHNFMDNIGGAEIVSLNLARELEADIYTTNYNSSMIEKMGFSDVLPRINSIGKIPIKAPFRQQMAFLKFRKLNLGNQYNFYIISGDWAMSAVVNHHPNLWYVHSPLNELWQWKNYIKKNMMPWWKRPIYEVWVLMNRILSLKYSKSVDKWVCNSKNTQSRIKRFYKQEAEVIYPPIDTKKFKQLSTDNYWLSVNRLLPNKKIDIQLKAFSKMPDEKLIIIGSYEKGADQFESHKKYLNSIKPLNVEIRNWVSDEELITMYASCKGFITTSMDEDFGMTVVEAMASGKMVIAPNEGGYKESITNKTGILIDNIDEDKLVEVVENHPKIESADCVDRAKEFDVSNFISKIKNKINE